MESVGNRTVCVVKDDPFLRLEAVTLLEEAGIPVADFAIPERALAYVDRHAESVCLVVAELRFPSSGTGLWLARRVISTWPWITVAVTGVPEAVADTEIPKGAIVTTRCWLPTDLLAHAFRACKEGKQTSRAAPETLRPRGFLG